MSSSVKDRVYAAAETISVERRPTVSTVRAAAGVSNADATRYLKEWTEEKLAAGQSVAAAPPTLLEQAARLAGACWTEASSLATERHAVVEAAWAQEARDRNVEVAELVADLDRVTAEKDTADKEFSTRIASLEEQLIGVQAAVEDAKAAQRAAEQQATEATAELAGAHTRNTTLQEAYEALLQRISPTPASPENPAPGPKEAPA
ncbi:DNA-binding protein [Arthrobacter sp. CAL618]|uniref:DNA-binding protein n=1 Tax=Arthrobacter sp. CAL618 TaxID=1055770 RepID=UPI001ED9B52D|nr:DNA-binding protein [Arthrobacter sp. CAL618]